MSDQLTPPTPPPPLSPAQIVMASPSCVEPDTTNSTNGATSHYSTGPGHVNATTGAMGLLAIGPIPDQPAHCSHSSNRNHGLVQQLEPTHDQVDLHDKYNQDRQPVADLIAENYATAQQQNEYHIEDIQINGVGGSDVEQVYQLDSLPASAESYNNLKVGDALNYLENVKAKFGQQPRIYNNFLAIMKEYKSQSLDTPGVVARVCELFRGHPELVVSFNSFLPQGYKIEVINMVGDTQGYVVKTKQVGSNFASLTSYQRSVIFGHERKHEVQAHTYFNCLSAIPTNGVPVGGDALLPISLPTNLTSGIHEANHGPSFTHSPFSPFVQSSLTPLQKTKPVEFNHAIDYVNKIKTRFCDHPEKYRKFLEIVHAYQNAYPNKLSEPEVFDKVALLFERNEDLLDEFSHFLPGVVRVQSSGLKSVVDMAKKKTKVPHNIQPYLPKTDPVAVRRPLAQQTEAATPSKQMKAVIPDLPNIPLHEAEKYGTLNDFALFDMIREVLHNNDAYESFLRCLKLYIDEVISKTDLLTLVEPILMRHGKLFDIFKNFLMSSIFMNTTKSSSSSESSVADGPTSEQVTDKDFSSCRRLGASYCALPRNYQQPVCGGRKELEQEVLNNEYVSFPTWSEDSTFVTSQKTVYEESLHTCEDERFEADLTMQLNSEAIKALTIINNKLATMTAEEINEFKLDDNLDCSSRAVYKSVVRKIYGVRCDEMFRFLRDYPHPTVPRLLKVMISKQATWREELPSVKKVWAEQMGTNYLKSLDYQGSSFKQSDTRYIRPKSLINEIETLMEERQRQERELDERSYVVSGVPHISLQFGDRSVLLDGVNILLHHVRRQSWIQKEDKQKIKKILKHFILDIFCHERMELSDDEEEASPVDEGTNVMTDCFICNQNGGKINDLSKQVNKTEVNPDPRPENSGIGHDGDNQDPVVPLKGVSRRALAKGKPTKSPLYGGANLGQREKSGSKPSKPKGFSFKGCFAKIEDAIRKLNDPDLIAVYDEFVKHTLEQEVRGLQLQSQSLYEQKPDDLENESYKLFYANRSWYVFLRLYHLLCERLNRMLSTAKTKIAEELAEGRSDNTCAAILLRFKKPRNVGPENYYTEFLDMIRNLLDGNLDMETYEDTLRERFGINAYVSYTLDKLVITAVRQLQSLVTDDVSLKCFDLYHQYHKKGGAGGNLSSTRLRIGDEVAYRNRAENFCETDSCTRIVTFKNALVMNLELMSSKNVQSVAKESHDLQMFLSMRILRSTDSTDINGSKARKAMGFMPIFLQRNVACRNLLKKNNSRDKHDYIARRYHRGQIPKYYCIKEPGKAFNSRRSGTRPWFVVRECIESILRQRGKKASPKGIWDIELDLLHYPNLYNYLYEKDIMITVAIPPDYFSVPAVVQNALIQKPLKMRNKKEKSNKMKEFRARKFERWSFFWHAKSTPYENHAQARSWFDGPGIRAYKPFPFPEHSFPTVRRT